MDRSKVSTNTSFSNSFSLRRLGLAIGFLFLMDLSSTVRAEVLMSPQSNEEFPESRFGSNPTQPDLGRHSYLIEKELAHDREGVSRSPAGLDLKDASGEIKQRQVVSSQTMPKSSSNLNPLPASQTKFGVQEIALIAGDQGYFPKMIFVTRDIPVKMFITGASKRTLCIVIDAFQVRRQIRSQRIEEISFIPNSTGRFRFNCPVNGMEGEILVKDVNLGTSSARSFSAEPIRVSSYEE